MVGGASSTLLGEAVERLGGAAPAEAVLLVRLSPPTPVSAALVGSLVDVLHDAGCPAVVVGASLLSADLDRGHRSVHGLARLAGLDGRTPAGRHYDVVDLLADTVPAPAPATSVLHDRPASRHWVEAPVRVVVGRVVTDLLDGYAAGLATLLGAVPEVAGAEPADVATDLVQHLGPSLIVLDGLAPAVGVDGARVPALLDAGTVVVATDPLLADDVAARLLARDRGDSRLVERAVARIGDPSGRVEGDVRPWSGVRSPHPLTIAAARSAAADPRLERVVRAAVGLPEDAVDDPVLTTVASVLTPLVGAGADSLAQAPLAGLLGWVGGVAGSVLAWQVAGDKDSVERRVVPLGFDAHDWDATEYDALPAFFAPFDDLLGDLSPNDDGMRWTLVDGATVFEVSREVGADFDAFVARVDVAAGISLMADYLGGRRVEVGDTRTTDRGTTTRQAERNIYLPQPNYLAAWGGRPIDVGKIELVERGPDQHGLTWRTVVSPNGSATYDDGSLTFLRAGRRTRIVVRGRQLFSLPPAWAGVDLDLVPELRTPLLEEAYRRFFTTTFDNLEACFEGREFRIGREPAPPTDPLLTRSVELVLEAAREWVSGGRGPGRDAQPQDLDPRATSLGGRGAPVRTVDPQGFVHVRGPR